MNFNIIYDDSNNTHIGFKKDLVEYIIDCFNFYASKEEWESVKDMVEILLDLNGWADNENLLVLSENNGMGYTIKEYEKETQK